MNAADCWEYLGALVSGSYFEEGIQYGDPRMEVSGILLCWMPNLRAIQTAIGRGFNLIVTHEAPFFAPTSSPPALEVAHQEAAIDNPPL